MAEQISKSRQRIFVLLTILLPFAILALVEGGLRLSGFGHAYPLFVEVKEAPGYLRANRHVARRFMVDESRTPRAVWIRPVPFLRKKEPGTFRIVVQGGSSAEGFPYDYAASLSGMLQQRLQSTFPDRKIEVITTAMSAVNSYTLLDFTNEIIELNPDAVVIYAGHNEYVGILGVGSGLSAGRWRPVTLAFLSLRDFRLFQLMQRAVAWWNSDSKRVHGKDRSLMATTAREREIALNSSLYQRGLEQFRSNLSTILSRYQRAGVPALIGTVASNERDQRPFISGQSPQTDEALLQRHLDAGQKSLESGQADAALAEFDQAVALDELSAESFYGRAQALDRLGRFAEARDAYLAAKDRDQLRFRAPEAINQVIREVASEYGAHVVDVQQALADAARDGIIGNDLMLEHLHPNTRGYFLIADAYYDAFRKLGMIGPWDHPISRQRAWEAVPVTEVDRLYGDWRVRYIMTDWPFEKEQVAFEFPAAHTTPEKIASAYFRRRIGWPTAMRRLLDYYRSEGNVAEAAKVARSLAESFPYRAEDQLAAYELLAEAGRPEAEIYRRRADALESGKDEAAVGP